MSIQSLVISIYQVKLNVSDQVYQLGMF